MKAISSFLGAILVICLITGGFVVAIYLGLRGVQEVTPVRCDDIILYPNGALVCETNLNTGVSTIEG